LAQRSFAAAAVASGATRRRVGFARLFGQTAAPSPTYRISPGMSRIGSHVGVMRAAAENAEQIRRFRSVVSCLITSHNG
jgi:hypothetical protein